MQLILKGKHKAVSREELRALICATDTLLQFHNKHLPDEAHDQLFVFVEPMEKIKEGHPNAAAYCRHPNIIHLNDSYSYYETLSNVTHEMIHLYFRFGWEDKSPYSEKLTSTLTARLGPYISAIASLLVKDTYKIAAYIAHTKIGYVPSEGKDFYDDDQYRALKGLKGEGKRFLEAREKAKFIRKMRKYHIVVRFPGTAGYIDYFGTDHPLLTSPEVWKHTKDMHDNGGISWDNIKVEELDKNRAVVNEYKGFEAIDRKFSTDLFRDLKMKGST